MLCKVTHCMHEAFQFRSFSPEGSIVSRGASEHVQANCWLKTCKHSGTIVLVWAKVKLWFQLENLFSPSLIQWDKNQHDWFIRSHLHYHQRLVRVSPPLPLLLTLRPLPPPSPDHCPTSENWSHPKNGRKTRRGYYLEQVETYIV